MKLSEWCLSNALDTRGRVNPSDSQTQIGMKQQSRIAVLELLQCSWQSWRDPLPLVCRHDSHRLNFLWQTGRRHIPSLGERMMSVSLTWLMTAVMDWFPSLFLNSSKSHLSSFLSVRLTYLIMKLNFLKEDHSSVCTPLELQECDNRRVSWSSFSWNE
jgi:hypothetical protein